MQNEALDRLAATAIMKWQIIAHERRIDGEEWIIYGAGGEPLPNEMPMRMRDWSPTTNEQHAAMVREKMLVDGFYASMTVGVLSFWQVEFWKYRALLVIAEGKANRGSLTYAITQAALLAVGAITEEELND